MGMRGGPETRAQKVKGGGPRRVLIFDSYLRFEVQEWYVSLRNVLE
jgi:hypothetical protein